MQFEPGLSKVVQLADAQLRAYNAADLEAFCACYAQDVRVLDAAGKEKISGIDAFRAQYSQLFSTFTGIQAVILGRVTCEPHLVEHESARRTELASGSEQAMELLVRYTERDGRIAVVQFLMAGTGVRVIAGD